MTEKTLLDEFAMSCEFPRNNLDENAVEFLCGMTVDQLGELDIKQLIERLIKMEAKYRYMVAAAMMEEREKHGTVV